MVRREEHLLIVTGWIAGGFDDEKSEHPGIRAPRQVLPGEIMAVIPAGARGLRRKGVAPRSAARDRWRTLLHGAIDLGWYIKAVPVDDVVNIGLVPDLESDLPSFRQAQHWPRRRPVVPERFDDLPRRELERHRGDTEHVVGLNGCALSVSRDNGFCGEGYPCRSCSDQ